jgi:hypothetical protein
MKEIFPIYFLFISFFLIFIMKYIHNQFFIFEHFTFNNYIVKDLLIYYI